MKLTVEMVLTDMYRAFHPKAKEHTFFSVPHGTFSKITTTTTTIATTKNRKHTYTWELNKTLLSDNLVKEEIRN